MTPIKRKKKDQELQVIEVMKASSAIKNQAPRDTLPEESLMKKRLKELKASEGDEVQVCLVLTVKINQSYENANALGSKLYYMAQGNWDGVKWDVPYVLALYKGVVKEVYQAEKWLEKGEISPKGKKIIRRYFEGFPAPYDDLFSDLVNNDTDFNTPETRPIQYRWVFYR